MRICKEEKNMHNNEATAHGKLNLKSLLICWLIILGGYLLIRMVFLVFGLCICGSVARIGNRCFTRLVFCSRLLSRS